MNSSIFSGTNGIFGPYQDVSRIFEAIDEARLVDADGEDMVWMGKTNLMWFEY